MFLFVSIIFVIDIRVPNRSKGSTIQPHILLIFGVYLLLIVLRAVAYTALFLFLTLSLFRRNSIRYCRGSNLISPYGGSPNDYRVSSIRSIIAQIIVAIETA